jgi:hypothetical protein
MLSGNTYTIARKQNDSFVNRVYQFSAHVPKALMGRRFFISSKGYIGLAPLGVEVSDRLCVLAGGRVPFIVRAVERIQTQTASPFVCRLIGDSYVHGLMDGEAMKMVDDGMLHVEEFELV